MWRYKYKEFPESTTTLILLVALPIILGCLLKRFLGRERFQWFPNTVNTLFIIWFSFAAVTLLEPLSNYEKCVIEQREIEKTISKWVTENANTPTSYHPLLTTEFIQTAKPTLSNSNDPEPISYVVKRRGSKYEYANYFVEQVLAITSKSGKKDTLNVLFQLTPTLEVTNVRINDELKGYNDLVYASYLWRERYGNGRLNLELEINGHSNIPYYYKQFDRFGRLKRLSCYKNSRLEGVDYYLGPSGDTAAKISYKNGVRNGFVAELCPNGVEAFWGETIDGRACGSVKIKYCSGIFRELGQRMDGQNFGIWKYWDSTGRLIETKNFGHAEWTDSLSQLRKDIQN